MHFDLNESQNMLRQSARVLLEQECSTKVVRSMEIDETGFPQELWAHIAELGWLGLPFPIEFGGSDGTFLDLAVLIEEMGRALMPGPFVSTVVIGGLALVESGTMNQQTEILPLIIGGNCVISLALNETNCTYESCEIRMEAVPRADGFVLNGTKMFVQCAHVADFMIVAVRTSPAGASTHGITLFLMSLENTKGITFYPLKSIASDNQYKVTFEDVWVPNDAILGVIHEGWPIVERMLERGAAAKCSEMVGGAQRVLEMTVSYVKERTQFGKPIGSFQAIQHHCADMATDVEASRFMAYQASWKLAQRSDAKRDIAMAKAWIGEAYGRVCALAHQCHGAIGFTHEHDLQLFTRRAKSAELAFGDPDRYRELIARTLEDRTDNV